MAFVAILLLLFICAGSATAQPQQYRFQSIGTAQGLVNDRVRAIKQDRFGYIWLGTTSGLVRYDGYRFEHFDQLPHGVNSYVTNIFEDSRGTLWLATWNDGLVRYDVRTHTFEHLLYERGNPLVNTRLEHITEDHFGRLWVSVGVHTIGVDRFDPTTGEALRFRHDPADARSIGAGDVTAVLSTSGGDVWVATEDGTLARFRESTADFDLLSLPSINALSPSGDGFLWIGTDFGLFTLDEKGAYPAIVAAASHLNVDAMLEDAAGRLWIGATSGLYLFDRDLGRLDTVWQTQPTPPSVGRRFLRIDAQGNLWYAMTPGLVRVDAKTREVVVLRNQYDDETTLRSDLIYEVLEDRSGGVWVATLEGLSFLSPLASAFGEYSTSRSGGYRLESDLVRAVTVDTRGDLWIGTEGGGLHRRRRNATELSVYRTRSGDPSSISSDAVHALLAGAGDTLWIGTSEGLDLMDTRTGRVRRLGIPLTDEERRDRAWAADAVQTLYRDRDGTLWIGTCCSGVRQFDPRTGRVVRFLSGGEWAASTLSSNAIASILRDRGGTMWIGTPEDALNRLNPDGTSFTRYKSEEQRLFSVLDLHETDEGQLWIATYRGGLHRFDRQTGRSETFTRRTGFPTDDIAAIAEDAAGKLWLSTTAGIVRFDPATGETASFNRAVRHHPFVLHAAKHVADDGTIYFGGESGLVVFHPKDIVANDRPPSVVLQDFRVFGRPQLPGRSTVLPQHVQVAERIILPHDQNDFTLQFAALHFVDPERNQYAYMLEGYDPEWRAAGSERLATYTSLPSGSYRFRVRAATSDGVWSTDDASVAIVILPPWWRTTWFRLLSFLLLGIVVYVVHHVQHARITRNERQRAQLREAELKAQLAEGRLERIREIERMNRLLRKHERRLREQNERLADQADQLRELDRAKGRFFSNISHEFRTPLTLILGPIDSALEGRFGQVTSELQKQLRLMKEQSHNLLELVERLLDLARLESGRVVLEKRHVDLVELVGGIACSFAALAESSQVHLEFVPERSSLPLLADEQKVSTAVSNLISNAIKFSHPGVVVSVAVRAPRAGDQGEEVCIQVSDTGPGIPERMQGTIFDRFVRGDYAESGQKPGTGIGLALAREVVRLHGGRIDLMSTLGKGSCFTIALPYEPVPPDKLVGGNPPLTTSAAVDGVDGRTGGGYPDGRAAILVVDDNREVRTFVRSGLEDEFRVLEADGAGTALEIARASRPDAIVCDVMMPDLDGYALCRLLKSDEALRDVPLLMLTARAGEEDLIEGFESGADDYLVKPFHVRELKARIRRLLATRRDLRIQYSAEVVVRPSGVVVDSEEAALLQQLTAYLDAHFEDPELDVGRIADEIGLSRRTLERRLRRAGLGSPADLIRRMRLERGRELLEQRSGSVAEIAYRVGFKSAAHFSTAFKKHFEISPSDLAPHPDELT